MIHLEEYSRVKFRTRFKLIRLQYSLHSITQYRTSEPCVGVSEVFEQYLGWIPLRLGMPIRRE